MIRAICTLEPSGISKVSSGLQGSVFVTIPSANTCSGSLLMGSLRGLVICANLSQSDQSLNSLSVKPLFSGNLSDIHKRSFHPKTSSSCLPPAPEHLDSQTLGFFGFGPRFQRIKKAEAVTQGFSSYFQKISGYSGLVLSVVFH